MRRTPWLERTFPVIKDNGLLPGILERLAGTPARLRDLVGRTATTNAPTSGWSPAREIGHLSDLEPLWLRRVQEIAAGRPDLTAADLTNRATQDADHDASPMPALVDGFAVQRAALVGAIRSLSDGDLERSSRHPRLGTPMRVVDLAYFVAEHDDHHMARLRALVRPDSH